MCIQFKSLNVLHLTQKMSLTLAVVVALDKVRSFDVNDQ